MMMMIVFGSNCLLDSFSSAVLVDIARLLDQARAQVWQLCCSADYVNATVTLFWPLHPRYDL